jgi:hypothetical protein
MNICVIHLDCKLQWRMVDMLLAVGWDRYCCSWLKVLSTFVFFSHVGCFVCAGFTTKFVVGVGLAE